MDDDPLLAAHRAQLTALTATTARFKALETRLDAFAEEGRALKTRVSVLEEENSALKARGESDGGSGDVLTTARMDALQARCEALERQVEEQRVKAEGTEETLGAAVGVLGKLEENAVSRDEARQWLDRLAQNVETLEAVRNGTTLDRLTKDVRRIVPVVDAMVTSATIIAELRQEQPVDFDQTQKESPALECLDKATDLPKAVEHSQQRAAIAQGQRGLLVEPKVNDHTPKEYSSFTLPDQAANTKSNALEGSAQRAIITQRHQHPLGRLQHDDQVFRASSLPAYPDQATNAQSSAPEPTANNGTTRKEGATHLTRFLQNYERTASAEREAPSSYKRRNLATKVRFITPVPVAVRSIEGTSEVGNGITQGHKRVASAENEVQPTRKRRRASTKASTTTAVSAAVESIEDAAYVEDGSPSEPTTPNSDYRNILQQFNLQAPEVSRDESPEVEIHIGRDGTPQSLRRSGRASRKTNLLDAEN